jgi:hypothetical protein
VEPRGHAVTGHASVGWASVGCASVGRPASSGYASSPPRSSGEASPAGALESSWPDSVSSDRPPQATKRRATEAASRIRVTIQTLSLNRRCRRPHCPYGRRPARPAAGALDGPFGRDPPAALQSSCRACSRSRRLRALRRHPGGESAHCPTSPRCFPTRQGSLHIATRATSNRHVGLRKSVDRAVSPERPDCHRR